jgi:hypothetical protein
MALGDSVADEFMGGFLDVILKLPTVAFTIALGVVLLYWLSVVLGALDLDILGGGDAGDHAGGDTGGDADGGDADGGDADTADGNAPHGGILGALGSVELRRVPMTVRVSFLTIYAWLLCAQGELTLFPLFVRWGVPAALFHTALASVAIVLSIRLTAFSVKPLVSVFTTQSAKKKENLVGVVAEVSTSRIDDRFGQILVSDGGAGLLIDARYEGETVFHRGDKVVITWWDAERDVVLIEPLDRSTSVRASDSISSTTKAEHEVQEHAQKRKDTSESR